MGGSFGKNKSRSSQSASQTSDSQFRDQTQASNYGTESMTGSESNSVWGPQGEALAQLYQMAFGSMTGTPTFQDYSMQSLNQADNRLGQTFNSAQELLNNQFNGGIYGDTSDIRQRLLDSTGQRSNMGTMYEQIVGGQGNSYVDPLIDAMRNDSSRNIAMARNANALDAAAAGQSGSSRHAMENAMMADNELTSLANREALLRQQNYDNDMAAKMAIAQQADQNQQMELDRLYAMMEGAQGAQNLAGNTLNGMAGFTQANLNPYMQMQSMYMNPMNNLANIIGPAIMEQLMNQNAYSNTRSTLNNNSSGTASSTGTSSGSGGSSGFGLGFGF